MIQNRQKHDFDERWFKAYFITICHWKNDKRSHNKSITNLNPNPSSWRITPNSGGEISFATGIVSSIEWVRSTNLLLWWWWCWLFPSIANRLLEIKKETKSATTSCFRIFDRPESETQDQVVVLSKVKLQLNPTRFDRAASFRLAPTQHKVAPVQAMQIVDSPFPFPFTSTSTFAFPFHHVSSLILN